MVMQREPTAVWAGSLVPEDGDSGYNVASGNTGTTLGNRLATAVQGVWTTVWQKTVNPGQSLEWGSGDAAFQINQGFMEFVAGVKASGANFSLREGKLRLRVTDPSGVVLLFVSEFATGHLHGYVAGNGKDAHDQLLHSVNQGSRPLPATGFEAAEYGRLVLEFLPFNGPIAAAADNDAYFHIPVTYRTY